MLEMINDERERAGVPQVTIGSNRAAQAHAEAALEGCFTGHWGLDGTTPGMRYALAGGHQVNGENVTGVNYCIQPHENFTKISNVEVAVRKAVKTLMDSPGHRVTNNKRDFRKVNIGVAWNSHNIVIVHQFEGDYVRFDRVPILEGSSLMFAGSAVNGATTVTDNGDLKVDIYFHPLAPLTRGQVAHVYCLDIGLQVASLIAPPSPGYSYGHLADFDKTYLRCSSPYEVSSAVPGPDSYAEAQLLHEEVSSVSMLPSVARVKWVVTERWEVNEAAFNVSANLGEILDSSGPGVYQLMIWGSIDGKTAIIADYPIFYGVTPPGTYLSE